MPFLTRAGSGAMSRRFARTFVPPQSTTALMYGTGTPGASAWTMVKVDTRRHRGSGGQ